jgi:hypothetical protein
MGNNSPLVSKGGSIAVESLRNLTYAPISRMHLNNTHGSPIQGSNR